MLFLDCSGHPRHERAYPIVAATIFAYEPSNAGRLVYLSTNQNDEVGLQNLYLFLWPH